MTTPSNTRSYVTLSICHMAGMIDLAALPLWVGSLMNFYGLTAPQAGLVVTTFLAGVVAASVSFAPLFTRLPHRTFLAGGFALSAFAFLATSWLKAPADSLYSFILLHLVAGIGAGAALSVTHGSIGRTINPHRLFGIVNIAMGALAIVMFASLPSLIAQLGGQVLFQAMAATMAVASLVAAIGFPRNEIQANETDALAPVAAQARAEIPRAAWLTILVIVCMALNQATVFSYVERIGMAREFGMDKIQLVLVVMGFVNLVPGLLAAVLQKRLSPIAVGIAGPIVQATLALTLTGSSSFVAFAVPAALYVSLVIFTHTFLFGLLARVDTTGRAVAATPAMMMFGSAIGPALGGVIVATIGYPGLGWSTACFAALAVTAMLLVRKELAERTPRPALVTA
jgi:predicted MFS family arabinose efflux permease